MDNEPAMTSELPGGAVSAGARALSRPLSTGEAFLPVMAAMVARQGWWLAMTSSREGEVNP